MSTAAVITLILASLVLIGGLVTSIVVGVLSSRREGDQGREGDPGPR